MQSFLSTILPKRYLHASELPNENIIICSPNSSYKRGKGQQRSASGVKLASRAISPSYQPVSHVAAIAAALLIRVDSVVTYPFSSST